MQKSILNLISPILPYGAAWKWKHVLAVSLPSRCIPSVFSCVRVIVSVTPGSPPPVYSFMHSHRSACCQTSHQAFMKTAVFKSRPSRTQSVRFALWQLAVLINLFVSLCQVSSVLLATRCVLNQVLSCLWRIPMPACYAQPCLPCSVTRTISKHSFFSYQSFANLHISLHLDSIFWVQKV